MWDTFMSTNAACGKDFFAADVLWIDGWMIKTVASTVVRIYMYTCACVRAWRGCERARVSWRLGPTNRGEG